MISDMNGEEQHTRINTRPLLEKHYQTCQRHPLKIILRPENIAILRKLPPPYTIPNLLTQTREPLIENRFLELEVRSNLEEFNLNEIVVFRKVAQISEGFQGFGVFAFIDQQARGEGHEEEPDAEDYCRKTLDYHG